jgi:hypothetical protein
MEAGDSWRHVEIGGDWWRFDGDSWRFDGDWLSLLPLRTPGICVSQRRPASYSPASGPVIVCPIVLLQ